MFGLLGLSGIQDKLEFPGGRGEGHTISLLDQPADYHPRQPQFPDFKSKWLLQTSAVQALQEAV